MNIQYIKEVLALIGSRLKELRTENNITQKELADFLGITPKAVSFYELNQRVPPPELIKKIADKFRVSIDFLFGYTPPEVVKKASSSSFTISPEEILHIKKYRTLDDVGKNVVDAVLETQIQRIAEKQGLSSDKAI